jgi:uncharacterized protein (DUF1330 family)
MCGLDPRIHRFTKGRWIATDGGLARLVHDNTPQVGYTRPAGSSPAMTILLSATTREPRMPKKAYWITVYRSVSDPAKVKAYAELAPKATLPFGAKYLCRGLPQATFEAGAKERIVITEYPSLTAAIDAHNSPGYQAALKALGDGAVRDIRIIEGEE